MSLDSAPTSPNYVRGHKEDEEALNLRVDWSVEEEAQAKRKSVPPSADAISLGDSQSKSSSPY